MTIESYLNELKAKRLKPKSIQAYRRLLTNLEARKPLKEYTKADLISYFNGRSGTENSRNLEMQIAKKYFRDIKKPDVVEWIHIKAAKETLKSDDILTTDDINKMLEVTDNHYSKALVSFLFETGCRISEALVLKFKDFQDTDQGMIVNIPTTKTAAGYRKVILPFSSQYIRNLKAYTGSTADDNLFKLGYSQTARIIADIAAQAGINKKVTCHKFRHAQATDLVKRGYNEAIIRKKLGWTPTSDMIARYQHLNDEDVINATLENNGKLPQTAAPRTEIKEAERMSLVDAAMQFSKLTDDLQQEKEKNEALTARLTGIERLLSSLKFNDKAVWVYGKGENPKDVGMVLNSVSQNRPGTRRKGDHKAGDV